MNETPNQTKKMLTRNPTLTALMEIEARFATHCVDGLEDDGEPLRIWAMNAKHADDIAKALKNLNCKVLKVQKV